MRKILSILLFLATAYQVRAQKFTVDTLVKTGSLNQRINIVYLGDGYTAAEQAKFIADVININDKLFLTPPYSEYKNYFNVFAVRVPSAESGIKHPVSAPDCPAIASQPASNPNNYFGTRFDFGGIHRLVVPDSAAKINAVIAANLSKADQVFVVGNTSYYGGSGGSYATGTTHQSASEIMIHELGHSFGKLSDEYWAGSQYARETPNMTAQSNSDLVKWKNWLNTQNIGVFQHTGGPGWYKPTSNTCKMEILNVPHCNVCKETIVERIHELSNPVETYLPSNTATINLNSTTGFKLNLLKPNPNTLKTRWLIDNSEKVTNKDTFTVAAGSLGIGNHTVLCTVTDTSSYVRAANHLTIHTYNVLWNLSIATAIETPSYFRASLSIFPNPFTETLTLQYKLDEKSAVSIQLVSMDGVSTSLVEKKDQLPGSYTLPFSMSKYRLAAGIYTVVFRINSAVLARELIKLN